MIDIYIYIYISPYICLILDHPFIYDSYYNTIMQVLLNQTANTFDVSLDQLPQRKDR
jgi:hypothetical protein